MHVTPLTDPLHAAFDHWTVGALVTNLLWTRCLGASAIAAAQAQRLAERTAHARKHSPFYRRAWRDLPAGPVQLTDLRSRQCVVEVLVNVAEVIEPRRERADAGR